MPTVFINISNPPECHNFKLILVRTLNTRVIIMTMNLTSPISKKQSLQNPWSFAQFKANLSFFSPLVYIWQSNLYGKMTQEHVNMFVSSCTEMNIYE